METTRLLDAPTHTAALPLIPHLLALAQQTAEQLLQLSLTVETHVSLDTAVEPMSEEDTIEIFAPPSQIAVLRRALKTEMQHQLKTLAVTTDALYTCATELARER